MASIIPILDAVRFHSIYMRINCYKTVKRWFSRVSVYFVNLGGIFCCSYCSFILWFNLNLWKALLKKVNRKRKIHKETDWYFNIHIGKHNDGKKIYFPNVTVFNLQKQLNKLMLNENYFTPVKDHLQYWPSPLFLSISICILGAGGQCKLNWESKRERKKVCKGNKDYVMWAAAGAG